MTVKITGFLILGDCVAGSAMGYHSFDLLRHDSVYLGTIAS